MMKVSRAAILPFSAKQMYDIVSNIEAYPEFLNWCQSSEILYNSGDKTRAKLIVSYSVLNIAFTTENENLTGESIQMRLVEGPFKYFSGRWCFTTLSNSASKTEIELEFDFDKSISNRLFSRVFSQIIDSQLLAFEQRAKTLYIA